MAMTGELLFYHDQKMSEQKPSSGIIMSFKREGIDAALHIPTRLLAVSGEDLKFRDNPPKKRGIVIALGKDGRATIAFPQGEANLNGYHWECQNALMQIIGAEKIDTVMHGFIGGEVEHEGKVQHGITVWKMPLKDQTELFGSGATVCSHERGILSPESYLTPIIAESLMSALAAKRLSVQYGRASASIYHDIWMNNIKAA